MMLDSMAEQTGIVTDRGYSRELSGGIFLPDRIGMVERHKLMPGMAGYASSPAVSSAAWNSESFAGIHMLVSMRESSALPGIRLRVK